VSEQTELTRGTVENRSFSERQYIPAPAGVLLSRSIGRIENPYELERYAGRWEQTAVVRRMFRQVTPLGGICNQWVNAVSKIDLVVKPGDPNDETSGRMADDARRFVRNLDDLQLVAEKMLMSKYYGYYPIEPVYGVCPVTDLLGPTKLFTLPPWHVSFDPAGKAFYGKYEGQPGTDAIPDGKLIVARFGSNHTPYGESVLMPDCLMSIWRIHVLTKLGLQAMEVLNRPIPWVKYPAEWEEDDIDELEERMIAKYKFCIMTPWSGRDVEVEFPTGAITASGGVGRSEFDRVNDEIRYLYIRIVGTPQTQNEQNASRGLETTRREIAQDQTPTGAQMRDRWLTRGILDPIGYLNWPNQPRKLWPVFDSDASEVANQGINGAQAQQLINALSMLALRQMTPTAAIEAICAIGVPRPKAVVMVQSTVDERDTLQAPVQVLKAQPAPSNDEEQEAA